MSRPVKFSARVEAEVLAEMLRALSMGSATTADVQIQVGELSRTGSHFRTMDQIRRRLRKFEAEGLVSHKMLIGPPGFCTFEWFLTDAGSAALATLGEQRG